MLHSYKPPSSIFYTLRHILFYSLRHYLTAECTKTLQSIFPNHFPKSCYITKILWLKECKTIGSLIVMNEMITRRQMDIDDSYKLHNR